MRRYISCAARLSSSYLGGLSGIKLHGIMLLLLISVISFAADKPRIFVTDSKSWEVMGYGSGSGGTFAASTKGGARPQTAEIIKTFSERCGQVTINNKQEKADYVVILDHEGGKGLVLRDNKVAVFNKEGDAIFSKSTRTLGNAVQEACWAIVADWSRQTSAENSPAPAAAQSYAGGPRPTVAAGPTPSPTRPTIPTYTIGSFGSPGEGSQLTEVAITSVPDGAEIEVDGSFVGNAPSTIRLSTGGHVVAVKKPGFKLWERKIQTSGGSIKVNAELEPIEPAQPR